MKANRYLLPWNSFLLLDLLVNDGSCRLIMSDNFSLHFSSLNIGWVFFCGPIIAKAMHWVARGYWSPLGFLWWNACIGYKPRYPHHRWNVERCAAGIGYCKLWQTSSVWTSGINYSDGDLVASNIEIFCIKWSEIDYLYFCHACHMINCLSGVVCGLIFSVPSR